MITNYTDNICEMERAANFFTLIDNAEVREEILEKFKKESKTLCDQRKSENIIATLKFDITGEKSAHIIEEELKFEKAKDNGDEKLFKEKIATFSEKQKEKFRIRKARQVSIE
jgi:hypothetical protein